MSETVEFFLGRITICLPTTRLFSAFLFFMAFGVQPSRADPDANSVFDQRIRPIFRSTDPSSCVQCHLSSVDLKNYILPSSDATFASLRDQGLVDLEKPERSKILKFIRRGDRDENEAAKLIHADIRAAELAAFSAWIKACCKDDRMKNLPAAAELAKPKADDEVIRHARRSRIVDSFARKIWSQRMRCFPCHTPHEIDDKNPRHQGAIKKQNELANQYDASMLERLAIFRETPEETLDYLVRASATTPADRLPLLNLATPVESLLLQKPLSKLPPKRDDNSFEPPRYQFPLSHMGGLKLHRNDQTYKAFVSWIEDYAKIVRGKYQSVDELPADNWHPTMRILRVKRVPETWPVGTAVQAFVYMWDTSNERWSHQPLAFTQGTVTPRRFVNGPLFLLRATAPSTAENGLVLPPGRYLAKLYVDQDGKIGEDPTRLLGDDDFAGEIEIPKARWRPRFRFAETIDWQDHTTPRDENDAAAGS